MEATSAEAVTNPDNRRPWRGEREADGWTGFVIGPDRLIIREPADSSGSFQKGAQKLQRYWEVSPENVHLIDNGLAIALDLGERHHGEGDANTYTERRQQLIEHLAAYSERLQTAAVEPLSAVAFFCHGWRRGFQLGLNNVHQNNADGRLGLQELARHIKEVSRDDVVVILYACATAEPPNDGANLAALLRDELIRPPNAKPQCRVVGHMRVAHAYCTPEIMIFEGTDGLGAAGRELAPPGAMRQRFDGYISGDHQHDHDGFRWAFPFMSVEAVQAFLSLATVFEGAYDEPR